MNYFVTGIDTDSGKTLISAILCEALQADYWKPIQAGLPKDSEVVKALITNTKTKIHPERHLLKTPASPHAAAKIDNITIKLSDFQLPKSDNIIIVEGAGGCLVPLNENDFVIDLIKTLNIEVVLAADLYLGSINHTLLTIEALQRRAIPVRGIIYNGETNFESEQIILRHSKLECLLRIKREPKIDQKIVSYYAEALRKTLA
jgi:dethiobiotin synthetase